VPSQPSRNADPRFASQDRAERIRAGGGHWRTVGAAGGQKGKDREGEKDFHRNSLKDQGE